MHFPRFASIMPDDRVNGGCFAFGRELYASSRYLSASALLPILPASAPAATPPRPQLV